MTGELLSPRGQTAVSRRSASTSESTVAPAGEPVVLLHGGFCSLEHLQPMTDALRHDFAVHAFERPGHGRSPDVAGPFTFDAGLAQVLEFLDELGLASAHVVGFSDGAVIGLLLAAGHPDRVRSLVAISGNLTPSGFTGSPDDLSAELLAEVLRSSRETYERLSPDGPQHADAVIAKLLRLWSTEPNIDPADLARITAPTLVVSGEFDSIDPSHSRMIASSIAGARLWIVPGATHDLIDERPDVVLPAVREFLVASRGR